MRHQAATAEIPSDVDFSDLELALDSDGGVSFNWSVIERICQASGLPPEIMREAPGANVSALIVAWYQQHRADGGDPDPVAEDLITEVQAENATGQHTSHQPGRA